MVSGWVCTGKKGCYENLWKKYTSPAVKANVPYFIALGNHDIQGDLTGQQICQLDATNAQSLTGLSPSGVKGASNYYVDVHTADMKDVA